MGPDGTRDSIVQCGGREKPKCRNLSEKRLAVCRDFLNCGCPGIGPDRQAQRIADIPGNFSALGGGAI
ncbi:MAG: hypothetical protein ABL859_05935, partial [Methylotenera sp.]